LTLVITDHNEMGSQR